jgi:hypothetical protein
MKKDFLIRHANFYFILIRTELLTRLNHRHLEMPSNITDSLDGLWEIITDDRFSIKTIFW